MSLQNAVNTLIEKYVVPQVDHGMELGFPIDVALANGIAHVALDAFNIGNMEALELIGQCAPEDLIEEFRFRYSESEWTNEEILEQSDKHFNYHLQLIENDAAFMRLMSSLNSDENIN